MIKSKPADNLPEHMPRSTCALSLYLDTSVHGSSDQHFLDWCQQTMFLNLKLHSLGAMQSLKVEDGQPSEHS